MAFHIKPALLDEESPQRRPRDTGGALALAVDLAELNEAHPRILRQFGTDHNCSGGQIEPRRATSNDEAGDRDRDNAHPMSIMPLPDSQQTVSTQLGSTQERAFGATQVTAWLSSQATGKIGEKIGGLIIFKYTKIKSFQVKRKIAQRTT